MRRYFFHVVVPFAWDLLTVALAGAVAGVVFSAMFRLTMRLGW